MLYTIRYRSHGPGGVTALIVEDRRGARYLFRGGRLRAAPEAPEAGARFARPAAPAAAWLGVPPVAPYSAAELCRLVGEGPVGTPTMGESIGALG